MNIYQQQILDNYHHPANFAKPTEFTHTLKLENTSCGDEITIYLNIKNDLIQNVNYEASGCAISIASASLLSEFLIGKTVSELLSMNQQSVLDLLGIELTSSRLKCAHLPLQAFQKSILDPK